MLPFRSGRSPFAGASFAVLSIFILSSAVLAGEKSKAGAKAKPEPKPSPTEVGLTSIPLPVGHVAKGLTLPDFDLQGHLLGRLDAGTAKRLDLEHVQFTGLKVTTFTPENQVDLVIDMSDSILNLKTKVLSSERQTSINRADFKIVGDTMKFDTVSRISTMVGNVKMVVMGNRSKLAGKEEGE